jgi:hypothetical protein
MFEDEWVLDILVFLFVSCKSERMNLEGMRVFIARTDGGEQSFSDHSETDQSNDKKSKQH